MTILEALMAELDEASVGTNTLEKVLATHNLPAASTYSPVDHDKAIDMCVIDILKKILSRASISEGGYSVKYDPGAIQARIADLYKKHAIEDSKSSIQRFII
ncbi:MAG TPA: DUF6706 family protein [Chitinophagaceae bacterium]|nr:DUF6706 family protein [Chitinophagaceae bacterium]